MERRQEPPDAAYATFYRAEFRNVARTVYLIVHDLAAAEDLTQDAFVQVYLHWSKVSGYDRPGAWVRRVAIRLATQSARRERHRLRLSLRSRDRTDTAAIESPVDVDLLRAVATLTPAQRAAVALHYYEDRPVAEVAELLETSPAAVKVALHRARRALANTLEPETFASPTTPSARRRHA